MRRIYPPLIFFFFLLLFFSASTTAQATEVLLVEITDTIDQSTVEVMTDSLKQAEADNAQAVILLLNTPGGGLDQTFEIAALIKESTIPVIGYVSPSGATAWSAGTFILLSTPLAAMADHTIIGSCQPIETTLEGTRFINDSKIINALVEWLQERAVMYGRNETLAKLFITENRNVNATIAKTSNVIEITASSIDQLLNEIDGRNITIADGTVTLHTKDAEQIRYSPSIQIQLLKLISNPILTSLLLMLGIFALLVGISSPGYGAEVFGIVAILLSLIGSGFTISTLSIIFIIIGCLLLAIEIFVLPGFGVVGIGGIICLIIGSIFLIPNYPTRKWLISGEYMVDALTIMLIVIVLFALFFAFLLYKIIQIRKKKPSLGKFIGEQAVAIEQISPTKPGFVRFKGEYWQAKSDTLIETNTKVVIVEKDETTLIVKPLDR
ncbi:MAG TPA: nodulation protein NfeD [Thermoplasmata archaeon]|jgi:membrane-bound serine protease (ClpP class)|nr:nodulation protein NfeD [Thermoplasmata archaeon]HIH28396.1 nodulation protein NfeD [Thermoplasmata archaeon]